MKDADFKCFEFSVMKDKFQEYWDDEDYTNASSRLAAIKECHKNNDDVKKLIEETKTSRDKSKIANKLLSTSVAVEAEANAKRLNDLGILPEADYKKYATEKDNWMMIVGISAIAVAVVVIVLVAFSGK
eukprot:jgi/Mesvir1/10505/Mv04619-RA.1